MKFFLIVLTAIGALTWTGVRVVKARHQSVAVGYLIATETERGDELREELRRLQIDRAALLSPTALEAAGREAGLRVPQPDQVVVLTAGEARGQEATHGR